jgi:hypothetical protein
MTDLQTQKQQPKPSNDIDLQAMTTFPHISSDYMSDRVRNKFREYSYVLESVEEHYVELCPVTGAEIPCSRSVERPKRDANGEPLIQVTRDNWANMELFTQDFRLGNLSGRELFVARYNIDLCSDILTALPASFNKPALISLERAVSVVETSQSKGGFLRQLFNTFFQHSSLKEDAPTKRNFFGMGKKKGD